MSAPTVPGIDAMRLTPWLVDRFPELEPPLRFTRVGEGQSNLTFRVDDAAGGAVVLRRPPLGETLASAHDVAREHRVLAALAGSGVPVPRALGLCEDTDVLGVPFCVMEHVEGIALTHVSTAERLSAGARDAAGRGFVQTLARLHGVDVDAVGLEEFRRPESLISRQLRRWKRQWDASKTRELPAIDEVAQHLAENMPEERETVLLHGDYHLHNFLFDESGAVRAVLDWELWTVGDPLADVGQMVAYWNELGVPEGMFREPVAGLPGFPRAHKLVEAYAGATGRDVRGLEYWVAYAYWKIAIIVEGVYRRWLNDPTNGTDAGALGPSVGRLGELALESVHADPRSILKSSQSRSEGPRQPGRGGS